MSVFFTSDSHFGHKNIVRSLSDWSNKDQCRDFFSIEDMNRVLIEGINRVVAPTDTLYHLGDFNFGGLHNLHTFRRAIRCETVHLILGNHDFKHGSVDPRDVDHQFASVGAYREIVVEGQEIILNHYAQRVWNRQSKGSWHLYGHSHGRLPRLKNFSLDVGVEGQGFFAPFPYSMNSLRAVFQSDSINCEDEHASSENSAPINSN